MEGITIIVHIPKSYWYNPSVYIKKIEQSFTTTYDACFIFVFSFIFTNK